MVSDIGKYMQEICDKQVAFSRLSRADRERAFEVVRKAKGSKVVTIDEMMEAHQKLEA